MWFAQDISIKGSKKYWREGRRSSLYCRATPRSQSTRQRMAESKQPSLRPCLAPLRDVHCSGRPWPWARELSAAVKGADSWKPSADHTPHSGAACPPLKGDLKSTSPHAPHPVKRQTMNLDNYGHTSPLSLLSLVWKNSLTTGKIFISSRWNIIEQQ